MDIACSAVPRCNLLASDAPTIKSIAVRLNPTAIVPTCNGLRILSVNKLNLIKHSNLLVQTQIRGRLQEVGDPIDGVCIIDQLQRVGRDTETHIS